jgi:hypothetical protein
LGGTLTDDTYFDVDGNAFALDGLKLETGAASTDATTESDHGTGTGWTLVVRDEVTGEFRKLLATNLTNLGLISSGYETATAAAADETAGSITINSTGIPELTTINEGKISVYRNGA